MNNLVSAPTICHTPFFYLQSPLVSYVIILPQCSSFPFFFLLDNHCILHAHWCITSVSWFPTMLSFFSFSFSFLFSFSSFLPCLPFRLRFFLMMFWWCGLMDCLRCWYFPPFVFSLMFNVLINLFF